jgi:hypothetical protein
MKKKIRLDDIAIYPQFQTRVFENGALWDEATVEEYAAALAGDLDFPPVIVWMRDNQYILGAGFHRLEAYRRAKRATIPAIIHHWQDDDWAMKTAENENLEHLKSGKPYTIEERKKIFFAWLKRRDTRRYWSNVALAELLRVSHMTIKRWRDEYAAANPDDDSNNSNNVKVITRDGRQMDVSNIGRRPEPAELRAELREVENKLAAEAAAARLRKAQTDEEYATATARLEQLANNTNAYIALATAPPPPASIPRPADVLAAHLTTPVITDQYQKTFWQMTERFLYGEKRAIAEPNANRRAMEAAVFCLEQIAILLSHADPDRWQPEARAKIAEALGVALRQLETTEDNWSASS